MKLKNIIVQSSNEIFSEKQIIETLESIMNFSGNNHMSILIIFMLTG